MSYETKRRFWPISHIVQRFIHMKNEIPKSFEQMIILKSKNNIVQNCTRFQIGALPGHQPCEHLFTLKSIISFYQMLQTPIIIQFFDIRKYMSYQDSLD